MPCFDGDAVTATHLGENFEETSVAVWRPSKVAKVDQQPSPLRSFLVEMGSSRVVSAASFGRRTSSME
jgi:hypothetical protein